MRILKTIEEMNDNEELCKYCDADPNGYSTPNGYYSCEGSWCGKAYERYLEECDISERAVDISRKVKITIERR